MYSRHVEFPFFGWHLCRHLNDQWTLSRVSLETATVLPNIVLCCLKPSSLNRFICSSSQALLTERCRLCYFMHPDTDKTGFIVLEFRLLARRYLHPYPGICWRPSALQIHRAVYLHIHASARLDPNFHLAISILHEGSPLA